MVIMSRSVFLVIISFVVKASCDCLNGWTEFDDTCYRVYKKRLIWPEAQFECEKYDAFLAVIETQRESTNIHAFLKEINIAEQDNIWIGLTDVRQEGVWVWENTKQNAAFFDWGHGEPNQHNTVQQDCVMLYGKVGHQWADVQCDALYYYLCERPSHSPIIVG